MHYVYIAVEVIIIFMLIGEYNDLFGKKNQNDNAFAAIDAFLKKRHDLMFPTGLMGILMGLTPRAVFAAEASDRENPDVARQFKA